MGSGGSNWVYDVYEAWNAGDMDRFGDYFAEDSEYVTSGLFPGLERSYSGPEGMRRFHADMLSAWDYFRLEPLEIDEEGRVTLIPLRFYGRGKASGAEVALDFHHVALVDAGRVRFLAAGRDLQSALETAAEHGVTPGAVS